MGREPLHVTRGFKRDDSVVTIRSVGLNPARKLGGYQGIDGVPTGFDHYPGGQN
jgi:hypothetical protein